MRVAIVVDRLALDELHDQVRQAVLGRGAVEEMSDVRVVQVRKDSPLGAEACQQRFSAQACVQQLDGNLLLHLAVFTHCAEHAPQAAASRLGHHAVRTDLAPDPIRRDRIAHPAQMLRGGLLDEAVLDRIRPEHVAHFPAQLGIVMARVRHETLAFVLRPFECVPEQLFHALPPLRRNRRGAACAHWSRSTAQRSHARAIAHSRLTVAGEMPSASAVSSTVRPAK